MKNRVVITGMGGLCSLGTNIKEIRNNLLLGKLQYKKVPEDRFSTESKFFRNDKGFIIDHVKYKAAQDKDVAIMTVLAIDSIKEALSDAKLTPEDIQEKKTGLCLGTSVGASFPILQRVKKAVQNNEDDYDLALYSTPRIIGKIASSFKLNGPVSAISTACASGTNSVGRAFDLISNGRADFMIGGGVDIFTELTYTGFNSLLAISSSKCRPFSKDRDGMSLGDACGVLIMESLESAKRRGAKILAEVKGYHILNEAYHATAPHPEGKYSLKCMDAVLKKSKMTVDDLDYINAHGTGTSKNDSSEMLGIENLLRSKASKTYMGSTKSLTGHTLGAAGSIEVIISILSMQEKCLFAVEDNYVFPDSDKINFVKENKENVEVNTVLSNSFGFGGNMASIVLTNNL